MLKLKLQYFGHLKWRAASLEKTLMLGKTECRRRRELQRMRWMDGITNSMDMSLSKLLELVNGQGSLARCSVWCHRVGHNWVTELRWGENNDAVSFHECPLSNEEFEIYIIRNHESRGVICNIWKRNIKRRNKEKILKTLITLVFLSAY